MRWVASRLAAGAVLAAIVAACSFDGGGTAASGDGAPGGGDSGGSGDGGSSDAGGPCADLLPFTPSNFGECDLAEPAGDLALDAPGVYQLDSDSGDLLDPDLELVPLSSSIVEQEGAPEILVVVARSIRVDAGTALEVGGGRAVAFVVTTDIDIDGSLSVGASGETAGAGGDHSAACETARGGDGVTQTEEESGATGGSGGGGGSFGGTGGTGGVVDGADGAEVTAAGQLVGSASLSPLRGGCGGGTGGLVGGNGGPGGGGGGAVQLVAGGGVRITGVVSARGGGGLSAVATSGGGGGGGSGGAVLIEATLISIEGALTANGGGGGQGRRQFGGAESGSNGHVDDADRASGGSGFSNGGTGGSGGALDDGDGDAGGVGSSSSILAGGGGGGGGVGRIHLRAEGGVVSTGSALFSPLPQ